MIMEQIKEGKRWSGLDWASEKREIMLVGCGGINSWNSLSLSRIDHDLIIFDGDLIDTTNVEGGQLFRNKDVGKYKVHAIHEICREFGCTNKIITIDEMYTQEDGCLNIVIAGLDNMKSRREVFESWREHMKGVDSRDCLLIDGRLLGELCEIFTVQGDNEEQIKEYEQKYLFSDGESAPEDCTTKQTTFGAMTIAGLMTATLCNWLTNRKLGMDIRSIPFYNRMFLPIFENKQINIEQHAEEAV